MCVCVCFCASQCAVNSEATDLFMSCGEIVNFSASAVEGAPLCFYICALRVCESVCPTTASQRTLVFLFPTAPLSLSLLSPHPFLPDSSFFFVLLLVSLGAGASFIHAPGPSMPFAAACRELYFKNLHS